MPHSVKDVWSFLGFANFYWCFIHNFADIAKPLNALMQKGKKWTWGETEESAFSTLKRATTSTPVLTFPSDTGHFWLECDASNFATGAILSQVQDNGWYHPVGYMSKGFSNVERNYQIHDKELLAIIQALKEWRHFLEGTLSSFEILTNHRNLAYFHSAQNLNRRQAWWSLYLSHFNFTLSHKPGRLMKKSDALSRRPDHPMGKDNNSNVTLLSPTLFQIQSTNTISISLEEEDFLYCTKQCSDYDNIVLKAICDLCPATTLSGEGPVPVWPGSVSTGIDPMCRGPASLKGPPSLLSQQSEQSLQGLYRDWLVRRRLSQSL